MEARSSVDRQNTYQYSNANASSVTLFSQNKVSPYCDDVVVCIYLQVVLYY